MLKLVYKFETQDVQAVCDVPKLRSFHGCLFVGGYYLTSVYASLCLIQSKPGTPPTCSLTNEAQEYLREWSRRRGQEAKTQKDSQQKQVENNTHTHSFTLKIYNTQSNVFVVVLFLFFTFYI